jgi:hypothetical protein
MKIYRDGKVIELTSEECRKVYDELEREYKAEDIRGQQEVMEIALDDCDVEVLVDRVEHALGRNDGYWDSYWCTIEYVIEEYMKEKEGC